MADMQTRPTPYQESPRTSFLIQYFNHGTAESDHRRNIRPIVESIRSSCARSGTTYEIVVANDSWSDEDEFRAVLTNGNEFLLSCHDVHEIRTYDRLIGFSRGDVVFLMQDDDLLPDSGWVGDVVTAFDADPELAVVGCNEGGMGLWRQDNERVIGTRIDGFRYVSWVNVGPYVVRRSTYERLGGFDRSYGKVGEPGIGFDSEFSYRCVRAGMKVGLIRIDGVRRGVGGRGTLVASKRHLRQLNKMRNIKRFAARHGGTEKVTGESVKRWNEGLVSNGSVSPPEVLQVKTKLLAIENRAISPLGDAL